MRAVTHAQIEPTTRCNFTCGFCVGRSMRQRDLTWEAFEAFLAAHPALRHVELQGEGEPLLHPRFFDMVAACRARGIRIGVITNGSLLGEATVERLLDAGIASLHVSMETADAARFQAIRGGLFAKVEAGLAALMRRRRERGLDRPRVGLTVTALKDTIEDIGGIHALYARLGLDGGIVAQPLQTMPVYAAGYDATMRAQIIPPALRARFAAIRAALAQAAPVPSADDFFYFSLFEGHDAATRSCPWLERGAYLAGDGTVAGCCFMKDPASAAADPEALAAALEQGIVPAPCDGCSTAKTIARTRAAALT